MTLPLQITLKSHDEAGSTLHSTLITRSYKAPYSISTVLIKLQLYPMTISNARSDFPSQPPYSKAAPSSSPLQNNNSASVPPSQFLCTYQSKVAASATTIPEDTETLYKYPPHKVKDQHPHKLAAHQDHELTGDGRTASLYLPSLSTYGQPIQLVEGAS